MRMKMFTADTLVEARRLALAELGNDAVILSEKETDSGFQVRVGVNKSFAGRILQDAQDSFSGKSKINELYNGPAFQRLRDTLNWHGMPERTIRKILRAATNLSKEPHSQSVKALLSNSLDSICHFKQIDEAGSPNIVLVGPPGHGRTACAAKLVRLAQSRDEIIIPIAADLDATAGADQLCAYLERDQNLVRAANTPKGLFSLMRALDQQCKRYVVDLPAIVPFDDEDLARLVDLLAVIKAEPVLVISAEGYPEDQIDIVKRYASAGVKKAIITKIDMTRRRGGITSALAMNRIGLTYLSSTPFIGRGLIDATPASLASLFYDEEVGQFGLKGAA